MSTTAVLNSSKFGNIRPICAHKVYGYGPYIGAAGDPMHFLIGGFDLAGIVAASVVSATLSATATSISRAPVAMSVARVNRDWGSSSSDTWHDSVAGEVDWTDAKHGSVAWSTAGCENVPADRQALTGSISITTGSGVKSWDVAGIVTDWLINAVANYGFLVRSDTEPDDNVYVSFDIGWTLTIEYTTAPSGPSAAVLAAASRRNRIIGVNQ
jgi:hypothetical protein